MTDEQRKALLELMMTLPKTKEEGWHFISSLDRQKREALDFAERTEAYVGSVLSGMCVRDEDQYGVAINSELQEAARDHMECVSDWRTVDAFVRHISGNCIDPAHNREEILRRVKSSLEYHVACLEEEIESRAKSLEEMQAEFSEMEPSEDDSDNGRFQLWDAIDLAEADLNRMRLALPVCWWALKDFVDTECAQSLFTSIELDLINSDDQHGYKALLLSR